MGVVMPSVRGMLLDEARAALTGLEAAVLVEPTYVSDVPVPLRVIAQRPEPGTNIHLGDVITLIVSAELAQ